MLDLLELEECFDNHDTKALFKSLDIQLDNAWQLFNLLDESGSGSVNAMDFVDLCLKVKGPAKSIDMACLSKQNKKIRAKLAIMERDAARLDKTVRDIWKALILGKKAGGQSKEAEKSHPDERQIEDQEMRIQAALSLEAPKPVKASTSLPAPAGPPPPQMLEDGFSQVMPGVIN